MQEFASVSASSYDPAALVSKLNERAAEGWSVVSIVPTGGDVTAFLSRETGAAAPAVAAAVVAAAPAVVELAPEPVVEIVPEPVVEIVPEPVVEIVPEPEVTIAPEPEPVVIAPVSQPAYTPTPTVPSGWYADPSGRFELRYWDGNAWTEHVSRAGQQFIDPPVA
jgi:hypothetical protein